MIASVQIFPAIAQGHLIQWTLKNTVPVGTSITIYRQQRDSTWIKLATVRDTYFFVDSKFDPKEGFDVVYKIVLGTEEDYVVSSFLGALPAKDRSYIKAIRRRETLAQNKGGGRPGFLLKKKDSSGDPSYYRPIEYGMLTVNPQLDTTKNTSPVGTFSSKKEVTRGLVYPLLDEGDVWVEKFTDRRFFITGKVELTYRGIPIIYTSITLSLVPPEHPVYSIPVK